MKFYSYFDGKTQFSHIFLGFVFFLFIYLFFFLGGGGGGWVGWTNHRVFHLWEGVELDCIDSGSLPFFLLSYNSNGVRYLKTYDNTLPCF